MFFQNVAVNSEKHMYHVQVEYMAVQGHWLRYQNCKRHDSLKYYWVMLYRIVGLQEMSRTTQTRPHYDHSR